MKDWQNFLSDTTTKLLEEKNHDLLQFRKMYISWTNVNKWKKRKKNDKKYLILINKLEKAFTIMLMDE